MCARVPPDCTDPNHLISIASTRQNGAADTGGGVCESDNADTGSAGDGGADTGSADIGSTGDGSAGGRNTAGGTGADIFSRKSYFKYETKNTQRI